MTPVLHHPLLARLFGIGLFIGMMATGYYYNITFIQLGLIDLGERVIGLDRAVVAGNMALFAVATCVVALSSGWWLSRRSWSADFRKKLQIAFVVILGQTALTAVAPSIRRPEMFQLWILAASLCTGLAVPATFGLTVDLVPVKDRGWVAALITGLAYLAANLLPGNWQIETFAAQMLWIMPPGVFLLGSAAFLPLPLFDRLAGQHRLPEFGLGRYLRGRASGRLWRVGLVVALMFGVFFVDSLGFLRLIDTPLYVETAWLSAEGETRALIGGVHFVTALMAGIFYRTLDDKNRFLMIFGVFALTHTLYAYHAGRFSASEGNAPLVMPLLYATAVSFYTVVNFALWADLSTPRTISRNVALGVSLSGWTATFLSTSLALRWELAAMPLAQHLRVVNALALLCFIAMLFLIYWPGTQRGVSAPSTSKE